MSGYGLPSTNASVTQRRAAAPPPVPITDLGMWARLSSHLVLIALALITRVPLIGNFEGEPDTARYVTGLYLWSNGDRASPLGYAKTMSAGYCWLAAPLAALTHASVQNYSLMLSIVSLCGTLLMASAVYELSRFVTGDQLALLCSVLFLLSPAIWWMGIQGHPQALAVALAMLGLYAYVRAMVISRSWYWFAVAVVALTMSLLMKIDAILLFPAFFGLLVFRWPSDKMIAVPLLATVGLLGLASAGFLLTYSLILQTGVTQVQGATNRLMGMFLVIPSGSGILRQAAPIVLALGPVLFLFTAVGLVFLMRKHSGQQLSRWLVVFLTWFLPGSIVWFFIAGTNPRHVAVFTLVLIWAGVTGWVRAVGIRVTVAIALMVMLLNFWSIPANSDTSYLLSPNVPGGVRALRAREDEIRYVAATMANRGGTSCFLGTYTVPYFRVYLLQISQPLPSVTRPDTNAH